MTFEEWAGVPLAPVPLKELWTGMEERRQQHMLDMHLHLLRGFNTRPPLIHNTPYAWLQQAMRDQLNTPTTLLQMLERR